MTVPQPSGPNSYRVNAGLCGFCPAVGGGFEEGGAFTRHGSRAAGFTDGLSNTIAMSEKLIGGLDGYVANRDSESIVDPVELPGDGFIPWPEWISVCSSRTQVLQTWEPAGRTWLIGGAFYTTFFVAATPDSPVPDCGVTHDNGTGVFAARSYHSGGVNILIADGSVRYVRSGIAQSVWIAMGTREAVSWLIRRPRRTLGRCSPAVAIRARSFGSLRYRSEPFSGGIEMLKNLTSVGRRCFLTGFGMVLFVVACAILAKTVRSRPDP